MVSREFLEKFVLLQQTHAFDDDLEQEQFFTYLPKKFYLWYKQRKEYNS